MTSKKQGKWVASDPRQQGGLGMTPEAEAIEWLNDYAHMAPPGDDVRLPQALRTLLRDALRDAIVHCTDIEREQEERNRGGGPIAVKARADHDRYSNALADLEKRCV